MSNDADLVWFKTLVRRRAYYPLGDSFAGIDVSGLIRVEGLGAEERRWLRRDLLSGDRR